MEIMRNILFQPIGEISVDIAYPPHTQLEPGPNSNAPDMNLE